MNARPDVTLLIDPISHHFLGDALFDVNNARLNGDSILAPYVYLREWFQARGIAVHTADRLWRRGRGTSRNVYVSLGIRDNYRAAARRPDTVLSAFFALECPIVEPTLYLDLARLQRYFKRIFSFSDAEALRPFLRGSLRCQKFHIPQSFASVHEEIWHRNDRRFLVMINANKRPQVYWQELYTERLRAVEFFGRTGEIDLYGVGWDGPPYRMGKTWVPATLRRAHRTLLQYWKPLRRDPLREAARRAYKGPTMSKAETLGKYTFALCFENMILKGWITEKIFDCFFAGTIPIYWGAPDIEDHVPSECFVDMRRFPSYQDLRSYLKSLTEAEIRAYKENARAYLNSPQFQPFTKQAFVELFARFLREDVGVQL